MSPSAASLSLSLPSSLSSPSISAAEFCFGLEGWDDTAGLVALAEGFSDRGVAVIPAQNPNEREAAMSAA